MFDNVLVAIIICVFAVLFVAITCLYRNKKSNFDERQLLARNIAFKISFFFLMVYCLICGLLHIFNVKWAGTDVQMFLGIIISFALFLAISILKDAFFSNSQKRNMQSIISFFSSGIVSVMFFLSGLGKGDVLWNNSGLSILALFLIASVCSFVLGILSVIKMNLEKRGAEN